MALEYGAQIAPLLGGIGSMCSMRIILVSAAATDAGYKLGKQERRKVELMQECM